MLPKITVLGKYIGNDAHGTWIGGKEFRPGKVIETQVDEDTYNRLVLAVENKWFEIKADNYHEWLVSRGRHEDSFAKPKAVVAPVTPAPVVEAPVEPKTVEEAREVLEHVAEAIIEANPQAEGLEEKLEDAMDEAIGTAAAVVRRRR